LGLVFWEVVVADSSQLSKRERQIMDVIFAHGEATITQVLAEMPDPPMRGALRTLLRIMEQKGHLTRRQAGGRGGEFVYRPTQARGRAGRSAMGRVLDVFFNGSLEKAVAAHLSDPGRKSKPSSAELQRLAELIEQAKKRETTGISRK
jgi:BlaI family transcriptional regulator, penicillinase repressor